ncbi:glucose 1-dehydrogenase [Paracoccus aminophilus]|uniref:3-ketoacyl-(Acyl-carrier-protein) reductase n=1 Tax=Paracoccus aminophilus JCM 7686 TaxID=1367847 RepID=S5XSD4_PARAH|nr:glucose 1-dehydrogenase [Paracoccus aminophilus]AGT10364.1 3-ketoacyl-(acyl-carrier-protein) reductase [Paracoccus aminophilus JCM 7686]
MRLSGKVAIVTGAASGFGEGIARKFAAEGAKVVVMDRDGANALRVAEELGKQGRALVGDVTLRAAFEEARALALEAFGGLHILVNNAGVGHVPTPLDQIDDATYDRIAETNMRSVYNSAQLVVPYFKSQKSGVVLNVASTGGVSPRPNLTWYNASKGWMISATKGMAVELAPFGIRVNAVNPVMGETALMSTFMGGDTPEIRARILSTIPLGRFSTPEDLGNAACFLCSDEASMITGVAMEIDGGRCL